MRRLVIALLAVALAAVLVIGLTQAGSKSDRPEAAAPEFDLQAAQRELEGSPPQLAALHAQASEILDSGFDEQLDALKGRPIVINKWASWCRPCRAEFPVFQQVATDRGKEIAFIGVNAADKRPAAEKFLADRPLPYPSYEDPNEEIAQDLKIPKFFPMTLMIDADGKTFIKSGEYTSRAQLEADIDKYLG
jgi:cytochrome c biogenesis protein CcmG, thiol:disulfide interchange protein DsbE